MFSLFWEAGEQISALGSKTNALQRLLHYQPWKCHSWNGLNRSLQPSVLWLAWSWQSSSSLGIYLEVITTSGDWLPPLELLLLDKGIIYTDVNALVEIFISRCECTRMCLLSCVYTCTCVYVHREGRGQRWVSSSISSLPYCMVWAGVLEPASHWFSRLTGQWGPESLLSVSPVLRLEVLTATAGLCWPLEIWTQLLMPAWVPHLMSHIHCPLGEMLLSGYQISLQSHGVFILQLILWPKKRLKNT